MQTMVKIYDPTSIDSVLLLAAVLVYAGAQATIGAFRNASSSSLPAPLTCPATSVNHIVQTLPQQCFTTAWPGQVKEQATAGLGIYSLQNEPPATESNGSLVRPTLFEAKEQSAPYTATDQPRQQPFETATSKVPSTADAGTKPKTEDSFEEPPDGDGESPLDNAHFLSFEEWKKQNLAKAGQSADSLVQRDQKPQIPDADLEASTTP